MRRGTGLIIGAVSVLGACSILAPSDDELLGGGTFDAGGSGGAATGGTGGATGGSGGAVGGSAGSAGVGATDGGAATGGTGGNAGAAGAGGSGATAGSGGSGGSGGTSGSAGTAGSSGAGGSGGTGTGGSGGTGTGGSGGTGGCSVGSGPAGVKSPALYVIVDRTGSMTNAKLAAQNDGVKAFNALPSSVGVKLALELMPPGLIGGGSCNGNGFDTPAVPMGALPGHASAIEAALPASSAGGFGSQLEGALNGGVSFLKQYATTSGDQASLVIITDWTTTTDPCQKTASALSAIASAAVTSDPPVRTFTVALAGAADSILASIAAAGGTQTLQPGGTSDMVRDALSLAAKPCSFAYPAGATNVTLKRVSPGSQNYTQRSDLSQCGGANAAWYAVGNTIMLCPDSCRVLSQGAQFEVTVGSCG